jgi:hypothetical protein
VRAWTSATNGGVRHRTVARSTPGDKCPGWALLRRLKSADRKRRGDVSGISHVRPTTGPHPRPFSRAREKGGHPTSGFRCRQPSDRWGSPGVRATCRRVGLGEASCSQPLVWRWGREARRIKAPTCQNLKPKTQNQTPAPGAPVPGRARPVRPRDVLALPIACGRPDV